MKLPFNLELLKYPIGHYNPPANITQDTIQDWIEQIRIFPMRLYELTTEITEEQYQWCYRPGGWSIRELIHHCADSHMNAFLRLKWSLFEENPTIKPYNEQDWVTSQDVTLAPINTSLSLLDGLHERWVVLLSSLSNDQLKRGYFHPESNRFISLDTYVGSYAWHCEHHFRHMLLALDHEGKYKVS